MISGIIIGFILPAILSIESYAYVKTYAFYISYIGFLHLGFVDGMYMKYGGKEIKEVNKGILKSEHNIFMIIQLIATIIFIIFGWINSDIIVILMGLSIIPINTLSFHSLFYQATGQFKEYSKITYIYTVIYLFLNLLLALAFRSQNYIYYCLINLIANGIVFIFLEIKFYKKTRNIKIVYSTKVFNNIKVGFFVLLANLSVMMFYAIDRWFVKIFLGLNDFAYYSFAISMLNIVNILVSSISITFYNYLAKGENREKIISLKRCFLLLGLFAGCGYFILAGIVSVFLKKYIPALNIISISFAAYPYMIVINALYVNLYKARKNEKRYLSVVIFMVIISAVYNTVAIIIWKTSESIAIATTFSFITWYFYSFKDFKYLKSNLNEIVYLTIIAIVFLLCSHYLTWFTGGVVYFIIILILGYIIYRKEILDMIKGFISKF